MHPRFASPSECRKRPSGTTWERDILTLSEALRRCAHDRPVLIAGPTASGKSALALAIAETYGGRIVNADALQVYARWRILTARPSHEEEFRAPHSLYGHVTEGSYSVGQWLRDVAKLLHKDRPIIVGGTGLYLTALTQGLNEMPQTPDRTRETASTLPLSTLIADIHPETRARLDLANRARVQRAWEVQTATGTPLHVWQDRPAIPLLPLEDTEPFVVYAPPEVLTPRIERRFDAMLAAGALEEARANAPDFDPTRPADRAIGAPELIAHLNGEITLDEARTRAVVATRQYAKRQRTWFRSRMNGWQGVDPGGK